MRLYTTNACLSHYANSCHNCTFCPGLKSRPWPSLVNRLRLTRWCCCREPWSCGYGRRLMYERSRVWVPAPYNGGTWHFSHWFVIKIVLFVWKDRKLARVGPFFKNKVLLIEGYRHITVDLSGPTFYGPGFEFQATSTVFWSIFYLYWIVKRTNMKSKRLRLAF